MEDFAGWKLIGSIVMAIMTTYVGESPYNRLGHFVTVQPELDTWRFVTSDNSLELQLLGCCTWSGVQYICNTT